jgi:hypothetical protein
MSVTSGGSLEIGAEPAERQKILKLIRETEAKLQQDRYPSEAPLHSVFNRRLLK